MAENSQTVERLEDLERRFSRFKTTVYLLIATLLLSILVPPIGAVLGLTLFVLAIVGSVLLLIQMVMRLLDLIDRQ